MAFVSVLLPAFNAERFVDDAIRSVAAQTFVDWEIVAVDDASRDRTSEVLARWASRDSRVHVFRNEKNLGMTGNWNACLSRASGTFVLKLDADDALLPQSVEILVAALEKPGVVGAGVRTLVCSAAIEPIGALPADAAMIQAGIDPLRDRDLSCSDWMKVAAPGHQLWHSSAVMTGRKWLVESGGYDERFGCASDTELILRLLRRGGIFAHRAYVGAYYRQTPRSISETFRSNGWLEWEGLAVNLRNLELIPRASLSRHARQRRAYLWREVRRRWAGEPSIGPPAEIRANLEEIFRELHAPPLRDRIGEAIRRFAARISI